MYKVKIENKAIVLLTKKEGDVMSTKKTILLAVDLGTQGLSVEAYDTEGNVLASAEGTPYPHVPGLPNGRREQRPLDWIASLKHAIGKIMEELREKGITVDEVIICITGQMHGLIGIKGKQLYQPTAILWDDPRGQNEESILSEVTGFKIPRRMTVARWLHVARNDPQWLNDLIGITTPAGCLFHYLTEKNTVGLGEGSGMFPIKNANFDSDMLEKISDLAPQGVLSISELLPKVCAAGQHLQRIDPAVAEELGLPEDTYVLPPEGDQPSGMASSFAAIPGVVSCMAGTSFVFNCLAEKRPEGVNTEFDVFCDANGTPMGMVCLSNGTDFLNSLMDFIKQVTGAEKIGSSFDLAFQQAFNAYENFNGPLSLPFQKTEPTLGLDGAPVASFIGLPKEYTPADLTISSLLGVIFNARMGFDALRTHDVPTEKIVVGGGILKDRLSRHFLGQLLADALGMQVQTLSDTTEHGAFGSFLLAKFTHEKRSNKAITWEKFLASEQGKHTVDTFEPGTKMQDRFNRFYIVHKMLLSNVQPHLSEIVGPVISG